MNKSQIITAVAALIVAAAIAGVFFYFVHEKKVQEEQMTELQNKLEAQQKANKDMLELAELDKAEMETEYQEFANQYAEMRARVKNDSLAKQLAREQEKTQSLLKQLKAINAKDYPGEIARLRKELETCRAVIRSYVYEIDSLNRVNENLRVENTQVRGQYEAAQSQVASLSSEKASLSEKVAIAAQLDAVGINLTTLGKNNKGAKLGKCKTLKIDFALARNVTATSGNKTVYVILKSPAGTTMGNSGSFTYENRQLTCTAKRTVEYGGEETPITMYYEVNQVLEPGTYRVSIFADGRMIGSRSFTLN